MRYLQGRRLINKGIVPVAAVMGLIFMALLLNSCGVASPKMVSGMYFDTFVSMTAYDNTSDDLLDAALERCNYYEQIFSKSNPSSELYKINHRENNISDSEYETYISREMYECLKTCIEISGSANNKYNPALGTVIELWDYHSDDPVVPDKAIVSEALAHTDIHSIELIENAGSFEHPYILRISDDELQIDLGGAAKGYIADRIGAYLRENGSTDVIVALGGNIYCIGDKRGAKYTVGIQKPFSDRGEVIKTIEAADTSVVTSGIYERYFEKNGNIYHHIIDTDTGYPVQNDLVSVSVVCDNSLKADILSTALLCMGKDEAIKYIQNEDIYVLLIDDKGQISGFGK